MSELNESANQLATNSRKKTRKKMSTKNCRYLAFNFP